MAPGASQACHVVVLAAGRGSRLGALGENTPKWLLEVGGRTLAERHLESFQLAGADVASVRVVTGHAGAVIDDFLERRGRNGTVTLHNADFARLNNWYSVLLAVRAIDESDARVVLLNGDLLTRPEVVADFLAAAAATPAEGLLAVDLEKRLTDESMKVSLSSEGVLHRIGKVGVEQPAGEYVGMLMARGSVLTALRRELERFEGRPDRVDEWYEGAVDRIAGRQGDWAIWPMPGGEWVEIDDDGDVAAARELVGAWDRDR